MGDTQQKANYSAPEALTPSARSASSVDDGGRDDQSQDPPKRAKRSFLTQNACTRCRSKKSKCDGRRPTCARCEKHGNVCEYDVAQEGLTRMQNLQQQLERSTLDNNKMQRVFNALQTGTDSESTTLLARLRLGATIDELRDNLGDQGLSPSIQEGMAYSQPRLQQNQQQPQQQHYHHQQQQQQQQPPPSATPQAWPASPTVDQADWEQWAWSASSSMSMSSASIPEEHQDQNMLLQGYYGSGGQHEPQSPYYYGMPGGFGSQQQQQQNMPGGSMQWQDGSEDTQTPSNQPFPGSQGPFDSQLPTSGPSGTSGSSSRQRRGSRPAGGQKRKG